MFDLRVAKPEVLYSKVLEVNERVTLEAWAESRIPQQYDMTDQALVKGVTGEIVRILEPLGKFLNRTIQFRRSSTHVHL